MMIRRVTHKTTAPKNYMDWPTVLLNNVEDLSDALVAQIRYETAICLIQLIIRCVDMLCVIGYSRLEMRNWYKELRERGGQM